MDDIWKDFDAVLWLRSKQSQYHGYEPGSQDNIRHLYFKACADEIEQLTKIAKAADLVSSMSSYDEDADEVDPCHMVYFEELEDALIPWRGGTATGPHTNNRPETTKDAEPTAFDLAAERAKSEITDADDAFEAAELRRSEQDPK